MKQAKIAKPAQLQKCTTHCLNSVNALMALFGMGIPVSYAYILNTSIFRQKFARTVPMVKFTICFKRNVFVAQRKVPFTETTNATNAQTITITMSLLILVHLALTNRFLTP